MAAVLYAGRFDGYVSRVLYLGKDTVEQIGVVVPGRLIVPENRNDFSSEIGDLLPPSGVSGIEQIVKNHNVLLL